MQNTELGKALTELDKIQEEIKNQREQEADDFWNSLTLEQKHNAFYSVVKRIYQGEIRDEGSYRYVLYDVFGFGPEAYGLGMDCGYLALHNRIVTAEEHQKFNNIYYEEVGAKIVSQEQS